jgi:hypothetical protein
MIFGTLKKVCVSTGCGVRKAEESGFEETNSQTGLNRAQKNKSPASLLIGGGTTINPL